MIVFLAASLWELYAVSVDATCEVLHGVYTR